MRQSSVGDDVAAVTTNNIIRIRGHSCGGKYFNVMATAYIACYNRFFLASLLTL